MAADKRLRTCPRHPNRRELNLNELLVTDSSQLELLKPINHKARLVTLVA
jgi:hypothetical protein